jgi:hypothetical protein
MLEESTIRHTPKEAFPMSTGLAPSQMLDLASSMAADRRRSSRDRAQRALVQRSRGLRLPRR